MFKEGNSLLLELWTRIKSHVPVKERLEVADILVVVFDEFNVVDDSIIEEDLDKELRAAVHTHLVDPFADDEHEDNYGEYDDE